jgi:hypothetical protein
MVIIVTTVREKQKIKSNLNGEKVIYY